MALPNLHLTTQQSMTIQHNLPSHSPLLKVRLALGLKALPDFLDPYPFSLRRLSPGKILFLPSSQKIRTKTGGQLLITDLVRCSKGPLGGLSNTSPVIDRPRILGWVPTY